MMKEFTGLTRSLLNLAKPRKKDRTKQNLGKDFPNQGLGAGSPTKY